MHWFLCALSKRMHKAESWQQSGALGLFGALHVTVVHAVYIQEMCKSQTWILNTVPICVAHIYDLYFLVWWQQTGKSACCVDQQASPIFMHNDETTTTTTTFPRFKLNPGMYPSFRSSIMVLFSEPQEASRWLRWMCSVFTSRSSTVYALLHNSLIMMPLPHAHTQFSAIIISQGHSWRGVMHWAWSELIEPQFLNWLNLDLLSNSGGGAAPYTGLWEKYISSSAAVLAYFDASEV